MKIGIDASRAFMKQRTGIEEYAYQIIKHLRGKLGEHKVILYVKSDDFNRRKFNLPDNWKVKPISFNYMWTQLGLSLEMLVNPVDVLFVPAHTVPFIHPKKTVVTIHGLEYEHCPESYSGYSRWFHRFFVRRSCHWARKIIAVSMNTKKDLFEMYKVPKDKTEVVYNGFDEELKKKAVSAMDEVQQEKHFISGFGSFVLFMGRLEKRKNIKGIIEAYEKMREGGYEGKLLLAGKEGYGYWSISKQIQESKYKDDIVELGFIADSDKWKLLREADVFMFPSLCEGFGIPILEAQSVGTPVITSFMGPLDEVAGNSDVLVDPSKPDEIALLANKIVSNETFKQGVIREGFENVMRFSWNRSALEVVEVLTRKRM